MKYLSLLLGLFLALSSQAQKRQPAVQLLTSGTKTSIRGLSVVDSNVVWTSGSNGTIGRTTDGGKSWKWHSVKGFEKKEFRDIEAFSPTKAIIMCIDSPAFILKTIDGGESWKIVYENHTKGMFLDAMEFWNEQAGIVVGDPIDGKLFIARTFDNGDTWQEVPMDFRPETAPGEAMFASSGTNVRVLDLDEAVIVTGGMASRVLIRNTAIQLPVLQGSESTGANSIAVLDNTTRNGGNTMIVVGGDFNKPASDSGNCALSNNRGRSWEKPKTPPAGYRSCVEYLSKRQLVTCGISGVDYSRDAGMNWMPISKEGFHVCRRAKNGNAVFLAGSNGKVGKLIYPK